MTTLTPQPQIEDIDRPELQPERPLLKVFRLSKEFPVRMGLTRRASVSAVDDVSFDVTKGSTVGIVGESGCGKSTVARLVLGLLNADHGDVIFEGRNITNLIGHERKAVTREMQMIFQDPYSALNPRSTIGESIAFPMKIHGVGRRDAQERAAELLTKVGLSKAHASYYPHQMSGGQRQRVNIARALALNPKLVVADEAVSALDKSVQAQVLNLMLDLQESLGLTYLFISHDLNVVEYISSRVIVMYLGQVVEDCESSELYARPLHPYTQALLASIPDVDPDTHETSVALEGEIPSPLNPPSGCRFRTRCPIAEARCAESRPPLKSAGEGHMVACHLVAGVEVAA